MSREPRILLLGGTRDAIQIARRLVQEGLDVTTSLAGRTREPVPVSGKVRTGGFGGAAGLARFITEGGLTHVLDATHPFAERISRNAVAASGDAGVPHLAYLRPPWPREEGDRWLRVPNLEVAAKAIPPGSTVLLALGRQHLANFFEREDVHFVVRMIEPSELPLPERWTVVLERPAADPATEAEMMLGHGVDVVVSRNSGGAGAYAKIAAARMLGLAVVMIDRPPFPDGHVVHSVEEAVGWAASSAPRSGG